MMVYCTVCGHSHPNGECVLTFWRDSLVAQVWRSHHPAGVVPFFGIHPPTASAARVGLGLRSQCHIFLRQGDGLHSHAHYNP